MLSPSDTAIVFLLALLLFGPDQLPKLARQLGEAMRHVQNTTHTFMQEMERAAEPSEIAEAIDHDVASEPVAAPEIERDEGETTETRIDPEAEDLGRR